MPTANQCRYSPTTTADTRPLQHRVGRLLRQFAGAENFLIHYCISAAGVQVIAQNLTWIDARRTLAKAVFKQNLYVKMRRFAPRIAGYA
jgi:hypothetical protein